MPWYVSGVKDGKFFVFGPIEDYQEAYSKGYGKLGGNFETDELDTKDISEATRILKARRADQMQDISYGLDRARHI